MKESDYLFLQKRNLDGNFQIFIFTPILSLASQLKYDKTNGNISRQDNRKGPQKFSCFLHHKVKAYISKKNWAHIYKLNQFLSASQKFTSSLGKEMYLITICENVPYYQWSDLLRERFCRSQKWPALPDQQATK